MFINSFIIVVKPLSKFFSDGYLLSSQSLKFEYDEWYEMDRCIKLQHSLQNS